MISGDIVSKFRSIHPFYKESIDRIFTMPDKQLFVIDGAVGTGKTSEFTVRGAYTIACSVRPIKKGRKQVRESKWAIIRTSENSAYSTLLGILQEAIFSPEIIAANPNLIETKGQHPKEIHVTHDLPDGTELHWWTECHGFDNALAEHRLKTHEFMGAMIPEMQGIKQNIVETAIERCGRWRAESTVVEREIDGENRRLSGVSNLCMVLADINFPQRPHYLYDIWYDKADRTNIPYHFFRPPQPIIPYPVSRASPDILEKWPVTRYRDEDVVWVPNPKAYNLTRHYEELDENENPIPWTGYNYWLSKITQSDSRVTRYIVGKPDYDSGQTAIYRWSMNDKTVCNRPIDRNRPLYVGYDPGGHSSFVFLQRLEDEHIHIYKEIVFDLGDNASNREQIEDFLIPTCIREFNAMNIIVIADPAYIFLGKSRMAGNTESAMNVLKSAISDATRKKGASFQMTVQGAKVSNTDIETRQESLAYFINQHKLTIDPSCSMMIAGLLGGYHYKQNKSGQVSDNIDKSDPSCDTIEAAQYPLINILIDINKKKVNKSTTTRRQASVKRKSR